MPAMRATVQTVLRQGSASGGGPSSSVGLDAASTGSVAMARAREALSLTAELVARVERTEPDPGPEPGSLDHTDAEYRAMASQLAASAPPGPFWLFAYGSLIWNPELDGILEQQVAVARGWHRSFCLRLTRWRGTRELPALMLALDRGGSCTGVAYRLPDEGKIDQLEKLLRREIDANPPTNVARWIPIRIGGVAVVALAFVAERTGPAYDGGRSHEDIAADPCARRRALGIGSGLHSTHRQ